MGAPPKKGLHGPGFVIFSRLEVIIRKNEVIIQSYGYGFYFGILLVIISSVWEAKTPGDHGFIRSVRSLPGIWAINDLFRK